MIFMLDPIPKFVDWGIDYDQFNGLKVGWISSEKREWTVIIHCNDYIHWFVCSLCNTLIYSLFISLNKTIDSVCFQSVSPFNNDQQNNSFSMILTNLWLFHLASNFSSSHLIASYCRCDDAFKDETRWNWGSNS